MSILSTREWAALIWGVLFLIYILCHRTTRKSLWSVVVIFFDKKLRILWEIILLYVLVITILFYHSPLWENIYIKDIAIWFFFSGLIYCMNAVSSEADENYLKKVLNDNLKFAVVLEFFMNTYTFNFWIEFFILPIITVITAINGLIERKEAYKNVRNFIDAILVIAGFWILYETIKIWINEYKELNIVTTLVSFMIPIVYLMLITPLEYALELYSKYEVLFSRMSFKEEKDKKTRVHHKIAVFRACKFSVRRVLLFQKEYVGKMYIKMKDNEFTQLMKEFRAACKSLKALN